MLTPPLKYRSRLFKRVRKPALPLIQLWGILSKDLYTSADSFPWISFTISRKVCCFATIMISWMGVAFSVTRWITRIVFKGRSRKLGSTCKKHPQILINVENIRQNFAWKRAKVAKKGCFWAFFFGADTAKNTVRSVFFSNYVEFTVRSVFLCRITLNFLQNTVRSVFFNDFRPLFFGGNNLPANFGRIFWRQALAGNSKPSHLRLRKVPYVR